MIGLLKAKLSRLNYSISETNNKLKKDIEHDCSFISYLEDAVDKIKVIRNILSDTNKIQNVVSERPSHVSKRDSVKEDGHSLDFYGDGHRNSEKVICVSNRCSEEENNVSVVSPTGLDKRKHSIRTNQTDSNMLLMKKTQERTEPIKKSSNIQNKVSNLESLPNSSLTNTMVSLQKIVGGKLGQKSPSRNSRQL